MLQFESTFSRMSEALAPLHLLWFWTDGSRNAALSSSAVFENTDLFVNSTVRIHLPFIHNVLRVLLLQVDLLGSDQLFRIWQHSARFEHDAALPAPPFPHTHTCRLFIYELWVCFCLLLFECMASMWCLHLQQPHFPPKKTWTWSLSCRYLRLAAASTLLAVTATPYVGPHC